MSSKLALNQSPERSYTFKHLHYYRHLHLTFPLFPFRSHPPSSSSALPLSIRYPLKLRIPQCQIHILRTLRCRALEQIINRHTYHHPTFLSLLRWHIKPTDLNAVLFRNVAHVGVFACDAHQRFAGVAVLVNIADFAGAEVGGEGDVDCMLRECVSGFGD